MKKNKTKLSLILSFLATFILLFVCSFSCFNFSNIQNLSTQISNNLSSQSVTNQSEQNNNAKPLTEQNNNNQNSNDASQNENSRILGGDTSSYVSVGELYTGSGKFNRVNLQTLFNYIAGEKETKFSTIEKLSLGKTSLNYDGYDSSQMRAKTYGKTSSQDIVVTLGGHSWQVMYLSKDTNGNSILTLWRTRSITNGAYGSSTLYATSNVRSYLRGSTFNGFNNKTSNNTAIADFIVPPVYVKWQEIQNGGGYPNCSWSSSVSVYNNMQNISNYGAWKDDNVWLPSLAETGSQYNAGVGYWNPSVNQMRDNVYYSSQNGGMYYIWLRSGSNYSPNYAGELTTYPNGDVWYSNDGYGVTDRGIRPAMHLNLTKVYDTTYDIWNSDTKKFRTDNLSNFLKVTANNSSSSVLTSLLSETNTQIGNNSGKLNASIIKEYTSKLTNKDNYIIRNSEIIVRFGGLDWYAVFLTKDNASPNANIILTLFLDDSEQLFNKGKTGTDGSIKYNVYGSSSWNSGNSPYKDGTSTISNNYGNSNIRTSLFSTASTTTNTASVFNPYLKTSSNYTAMGDFIVSPNALNMQDAQNLQKTQTTKSTLGFRYNLPNESYSNLINYSTPYKALSLSASTTNYTAWQNDKLWLPSLSEVGLGSNNTISTNTTASNNLRTAGLWGLSTAQRSNTNKTATWLRSGHITDKNLAYTISADGTEYGYATIDTQNAVRPALHLNLTLACQYAS